MPHQHAHSVSRRWRLRCGLFALAALPRLLYLAAARPRFEGYHSFIADNLLIHGFLGHDGVKASMYEPLYPLFLAAARVISHDTVAIVQVLQLAVDSVGAVLLYLLIEALTARRRAALFGAALYAFYPLLIRHSVVGDEFSLLSVLLVAFAYSVVTATTVVRASAAGIWISLAMLTRSMVAPVVLLTAALFVVNRRYRIAVVFTVTAVSVLSPWLVRNYTVSGALWPTRGGENLFHGNSRYTAALLPDYNLDVLVDYGQSLVARERPDLLLPAPNREVRLDPTADREVDQVYKALAWNEITTHPWRTLQLKLWNVAYFFWPRLVPSHLWQGDTRLVLEPEGGIRVENSRTRPIFEDVVYTVSYSLVAAAALLGVWIRRRRLREDAVLWCIVVTFVMIHALFFPATRYRVPMEFVLLYYAAVALDATLPARAVSART